MGVKNNALFVLFMVFLTNSEAGKYPKITSITIEYLQTNEFAHSTYLSSKKWGFSEDVEPPTTVAVSSKYKVDTSSCGSMSQGDLCVLTPSNSYFPKKTKLVLTDVNDASNEIDIYFSTKCRKPDKSIVVGDTFGSLRIAAMETSVDEDADDCDDDEDDGEFREPDDGTPKRNDDNDQTYDSTCLVSLTLRYVGYAYGGGAIQSACANDQGPLGQYWKFTHPTPQSYPTNDQALIVINGHDGVQIDPTTGIFQVSVMSSAKKTAKSASNKKKGKKDECMPTKTRVVLFDGSTAYSNKVGFVVITTSCDRPLSVGDRFGFLEVVALTTSDDEDGGVGSSSCNNRGNSLPRDTTSIECVDIPIFPTILPQPETTEDPNNVPGETTRANNGDMQCSITLHSDGLTPGVCASGSQTLAVSNVDVSIGFGTQLCTSIFTSISGTAAELHVTVQPICQADVFADQQFRVCSFVNTEDITCLAIPPEGRRCCDPISESVPSAVSCQVYAIGDCFEIQGFDGTSGQTYHLSLDSCAGTLPTVPLCGSLVGEGSVANSLVVEHPVISASVAFIVGVAGGAFVIAAVMMRLNRARSTYSTLSDIESKNQCG